MQIGVIGLGRMGSFYAQTLAHLGRNVQLAAVSDPDPRARENVASRLSVPRVLADYEAMFQGPRLDAVVIASPASAHADQVVAAARAGVAILCEKPLALTLEQTRAVLTIVQQASATLQVGFMRRFDTGYRQAKQLIDAGRIGRPTIFKAIGRDPTCPSIEYAHPARSGGLMADMAIHDFDLARWLMSSEVERVTAEGANLACEALASVGDIDNAVINLRFANGAIGNVEVSRNARYGYDVRTEVLGSEGAVSIGDPAVAAEGDARMLARPTLQPNGIPFFIRRFEAAYTAQIEDFIDCVEHGRQPAIGGVDALAAFEIASAATISWQTRNPVALSELRAANV